MNDNLDTEISGGLFIALYDEDSLKLYLNKGIYGFIMKPEFNRPSSRSRYYSILADYACSREGTDVFFFLKRKIVYGGKVYGNKEIGSFYINGNTSPLGREAGAELFWDESVRERYIAEKGMSGVFRLNKTGGLKAQPFIFQFNKVEDTGKYIVSDELYFELGKYPYPLPSNSMQNMGFCTLSPGEVSTLKKLISNSKHRTEYEGFNEIEKDGEETIFRKGLVSINDELINEAQLEFTILSSLEPFAEFLNEDYVLCRQVPISPFKPSEMDRADICLYNKKTPIKNGTIPNVVIELKKDKKGANFHAYEQVTRYLKWLEAITDDDEFNKIQVFIIAPEIGKIKRSKVDTKYEHRIKMYSINKREFVSLAD